MINMADVNLDTIEKLVQGDPVGGLYDLVSTELGIFLVSMIAIGILGSTAIYSRSIAVPGVLVVFTLPVIGAAVGGVVGQLLAQFGIVVIVYLLYKVFTQ